MAVKKKKNAPLQEIELDAAVQAYLETGTQAEINARREKEVGLSKSKRKKRERDKKRSRVWYDLPGEIIQRVEEIAAEYDIPKSQLAAFLLDRALREYDNGDFNLSKYLRPSRHPRFASILVLPDDADDGWEVSGWEWKKP